MPDTPGQGLFDDDQVPMAELRERAFNLRWATVDPDVIALTAADPDFGVAPEIRAAITDYAASGVFSYGPTDGLPVFREVVSATMRTRRSMRCTPDLILPTNSAASAMFVLARHALSPGDEALIFDPVDFLFGASVEAAGGRCVRCPMDADTGGYDLDALERLVTPRTKMIGVCNPHNPFGRVLTRVEAERIGALAVEHDLVIMADEIWSDIVYPGVEFFSMASLSDAIAAQTVSVYGFSKTFGLAGLRVGFLVAPNATVFEGLMETSTARTTAFGVSTVSQVAAAAAYERCWYWADAFVEHLTGQRDYAVQRLNAMPGVTCRSPQGTYLVFPNVSAVGLPSGELVKRLLRDGRVAVVPGEPRWFGPAAQGHVRICFSTSRAILADGLDRIEGVLTQLSEAGA